MKGFIIIVIGAFFCSCLYSQDTLKFNFGKKGKLYLLKQKGTDTVTQISFTYDLDTKEKIEIDTLKKVKKERKFNPHLGGIYYGINSFVYNYGLKLPEEYSLLELNHIKSRNFRISINMFKLPIINQNLGLAGGIGLDFNNFRFRKNVNLIDIYDKLQYQLDTVLNYDKNKLTLKNLIVPILLEYQVDLSKKTEFYINCGVIGKLIVNSYTKKYVKEKSQEIKINSDYFLNPFQMSFHFLIGFNRLGIYFDYCPFSLFKRNKGPNLNVFSMGIYLS